MVVSDDLFYSLKGILEANYHLKILERQEEYASNESDTETDDHSGSDAESEDELTRNLPRHPLSFYDRHVASNLTLKNIRYLPSITQSLSEACDKAIKELSQRNYALFSKYPFLLRIPEIHDRDAISVGQYYYHNVGRIGHIVATKLLMHFRHMSWDTAFDLRFDGHDNDFSFGLVLDFLCDSKSGRNLPQIIYEHLPENIKDKYLSLSDNNPSLGVWHFFPMTDAVMKMFRTFTKSSSFHWETARTSGRKNKSFSSLSPDANDGKIMSVPRAAKSRSSASTSKEKIQTQVAKHILPVNAPWSHTRSCASFKPYIQRVGLFTFTVNAMFLISLRLGETPSLMMPHFLF